MEVLKRRGYTSLIRIDRGGQARVYKSVKNGKEMAIKVIRVKERDDDLNIDQRRELKILLSLRHPNCIQIEDLFRTKNKIYVIMTFMPNGNVRAVLKKYGPLCEWNARCWFGAIVRAIKYLHERKIAHRDLKLENILLDAYLNPIVTDFGLSLFVPEDEKGNIILSKSYCGTPSYFPPEMLKRKPYNPYKVDIWCLGVMLFTMVDEKYPFNAADKGNMYRKQMNREYKFNPTADSSITDEFKDFIHQMLTPLPQERPTIKVLCEHRWLPIVFREKEILETSNRLKNPEDNLKFQEEGDDDADEETTPSSRPSP